LQTEKGTVSTNSLALALQTKAASITDMTKKLNAKKLLHYKPYYGFYLSAEGKKVAIDIIRRHRLWESFLSQKLKFPGMKCIALQKNWSMSAAKS